MAGFTVANDVSARDWQMKRNGKQWLLGKTFDSFCPLGPALVTKDAVKGERKRVNKDSESSSYVVLSVSNVTELKSNLADWSITKMVNVCGIVFLIDRRGECFRESRMELFRL